MLKELYTLMDKEKIKVHYAKIIALTFDEKPIREIQGSISSGSMSVNGNSAVRRTINLSMLADEDTNKLTNLNNIISINKKVKIEVGYKNNFPKYKHLGEIIWFPLGTYIVEKVSLAKSTTGSTITINGKDKMAQLDGTIGGILPSSVTFHEKYIQNEDGSYDKEVPTIYEIIKEAVNHFGKEPVNNIFINDLDEESKMLVRYYGDTPVWFDEGFTKLTVQNSQPTGEEWLKEPYYKGENIGYMNTPMTYPGELIMDAGSTVVQLLDKIVQTLGKTYEYFYDLDGRFVFQKIRNYRDESYTPITEINGDTYIKYFIDSKYQYAFTDGETQVSVNYNPQYENIKNDFIVWGSRETAAGASIGIRYHLAIDEKPTPDLALKWMYLLKQDGVNIRYDYFTEKLTNTDAKVYYEQLLKEGLDIKFSTEVDKEVEAIKKAYEDKIKEINTNTEYTEEQKAELRGEAEKNRDEALKVIYEITIVELIGEPVKDEEAAWREELYRRALETQLHGSTEAAGYYDEELLAEWRKLYGWFAEGTLSSDEESSSKLQWGWNPQVYKDPSALDYWLDFIDSGAKIGEFSVNSIGRRTKIVKNDNIKSVYNKFYESILFTTDKSLKEDTTVEKIFYITEDQKTMFNISSTGTSCYDTVRELLYQHLVYNVSANITCTPKYYLEPNTLIRIEDKECGIYGDFVINQLNLPLGYSGTMSITANEALVRV